MVDPIVCVGVGCWEYLPEPWKTKMEKLSYTKNGQTNFPVYTKDEYDRIPHVLENSIGIFTDMIRKTCRISAEVSADHAPDHIRKNAEYSGALVYRFNSLHKIVNKLYDVGWLKPVEDIDKPAMCVVAEK